MFVLFVPYLFLADISFAKQCGHDEFLYKYTECDHHGERWRIAVPKTHSLQCDNVPPPQPGVNCSFSCSAGRYLDMESQECRVCPAGTYSLGDGVRYEEFTQFPPGFSVENYVDDTAQALSAMVSTDAQAPIVCSNENGWVIQSGEIRYVPTPCISKLSISLHLVRSGFIEIYYKMPKNSRGLLAELTVRNEQCQSYGNARSYLRDHHPSGDQEIPTGNGDWRIRRLNLRAGQNLLTWTVSNNRELTTLSDVVYVPKIDIVGLAFTPSCTPCAKGAYSKSGAKQCEACQPGFFSNKGATKCEKCSENEYSGLRASKCIAKPPCHAFDYYPVAGSCANNSTSTEYQKLLPEVCQENSPASVARPSSETRNCKPCSPGMYRSADGTCRFCGRGEYSSEGTECHVCPEHTTPNYGLFFTNWDQMPSQLWTTCEYLASEDGDSCDVKPSWIGRGDHVETAPTRAVGVALELSLNLTTGFYNPLRANTGKISEENPIGWISFDLELTCADDSCLLYFVEVMLDKAAKRSFFRFLAAFNGTQKRQQFHYPVIRDRPGRFVFAFTRSGAGVGSDVITDKAVIYSLNVTHTGDPETKRHFGGADSCLPCPSFDAITGECRPCPAGHYIEAGDNRCIKCPPGTAMNLTSSQVGPQSCAPCGPNLDSEDRTTCGFSGKLTLPADGNRTMKFDFSALRNKTLSADGVKVFAREGNSYFHRFNASLFGEPLLCHEDYNIQLLDFTYGRPAEEPGENAAVFCRATMIPTGGEAAPVAAKNNGTKKGASGVQTAMPMSAFSIAQKLAAVTLERSFRGFHLSDALLEYESSSPSTTRPIDVHFFYEPTVKHAANCKNGTIGVVTARCQPSAGKLPEVRLSRACPDGTCDGCLYHMFVETSYACPVCNPEDFEEIRGECIGGYQKIHSIPFKHCTAMMDKSIERTERCTASGDVRFLLFVAAFVIALLVMVIVIIYMKNKSLEHRYMRIIEGKEPEDLNSCGLESEDDEEFEEEDPQKTRVFFGKNKKNDYVAGISKTSRLKKPPASKGIVGESERTEFLSDSLSD